MRKIFIISLLLTNLVSVAQDKQWTLNECMKYAIENSPKVKKDEAQNSVRHQNYIEAIGRLLPKISVGTNTYFNFGRGVDSETNTYTDINTFSNSYSINGSIVLFDGLSNISKLKMEKVNKLIGKQQFQQDKDMAAYETLEAAINLVYYEQMISLAEEQLVESERNLQQVQRMEELGVKGFPDVAEMKAKQAADAYNLTKQQNIMQIGVIVLKEKMNYPIDEDLKIDKHIVSNDCIALNENISALELYNKSLTYLPQALASSLEVKAKALAHRSVKANLLPTISAEGGYSTNFSRFMNGSDYIPFKDQLREKRGYYVGISLSVPLFTGFSKTANIKRSKAELVISKTEHDETLRKLYSEIEQAVTDLKGFAAEYHQALTQVEAIQVAHDVNQKKYDKGLISPIELHTSANRLLKVKSDELQSKLMYEVKKKMVNYYNGVPFVVE